MIQQLFVSPALSTYFDDGRIKTKGKAFYTLMSMNLIIVKMAKLFSCNQSLKQTHGSRLSLVIRYFIRENKIKK